MGAMYTCLQGVGMGGKGDRREGKHEVIGEERSSREQVSQDD